MELPPPCTFINLPFPVNVDPLPPFPSFKGALSSQRQLLTTENPLKMMKYAFSFRKKLLLFSRYLSFCLVFLVMYKSGLIRKIRLNSKFTTS